MNKLLFVGGSQRSGTSLLQLLLSQDDETNPMTREVSYLSHLMASYHASKIDPTNALAYFNDLDELKTFHASIVERFLEVVHKRFPDAKHLVLKEPHLTLYFPDLHELISDVKFVVVIRDPRDTVASMVEVGERLQAQGASHFFQKRDMTQLSKYYKHFYAPSLDSKNESFNNSVLVVRYEDLVMDPEQVIERLRNFTGLALNINLVEKPDPGKLDYTTEKGRYHPWITSKDGKNIDQSSVGRYKQVLRPHEIKEVESCCQGVMSRFSYSI